MLVLCGVFAVERVCYVDSAYMLFRIINSESLIAEADAAMYKVKSVHHANVGDRSGVSPTVSETNKVATLVTMSNEASIVRSRSD
jgi:hypothetical protein